MLSARSVVSKARLASVASRRWASDVATFTAKQEYKGHKIDDLPSGTAEFTKEEAWKYFKDMSVIRRMETTAGELYRSKYIRGFCHLYSGQEAVCVGMMAGMKPEDSFITAYRCHGWAYCHGYSVKQILAELFGNSAGASQGLGGSMHFYGDKFYGGNGIVGAQVPVGAGVALAHQYANDNGVCFTMYGDGAANQGQVFEAYNMAKLWNLPCVFVCENNKYGMGTSASRAAASVDYYTRGDYVPGIWVDGMDIVAVREATKWASEYASKNGPLVMEVETYRYHGHSMSDPDTTYRTRDDIKKVRTTFDPILLFRNHMVEAGFATEDELKAAEKEIRASVKAEADEALAAPPTSQDLLTKFIHIEETNNVRGCDLYTVYNQK
ncbi:pyruvate dehydrogenase E1 component alpha [Salpingoeca rosetta]|uniref:Pyruvate dehydrogenase E1 component subunit alpha n=1 Tax=Salpingoeca rosetta (strain ATCC 50818 / BSB-021) TaxID=946362 RepID=F2U8M7_SALR5|nr:pyruvate dehydrogenase E1 component alpha [Salpingoeca rosetta]EGD72735.1 pyruvate dehydrogenase E1 component alpha [Salpingoeca rosetta]|eukprot:XP_004994558.1 pyruvate dehydrogenase E1 component alpha [Salpingoeca rosetta]